MAVLLSSFQLFVHGCLELSSRFASPNALVPRVLNLFVASGSRSTFFEPRTAAATATHFPGFLDGNAFAAYRTDGDCWRFTCGKLMWEIVKYRERGNEGRRRVGNRPKCNCSRYFIELVSLELTFACLHSVKPPVTQVSVGNTSTLLVPSAARSATTDSA